MRSLKNQLGFILPLIALLFAIEFSLTSDKIVQNYEALMNNDYNIVIVSSKELDEAQIRPLVPTFDRLEPLSAQGILDRLSDNVSAKNLSVLQNALPKFYSLKLSAFPSTQLMNEIKDKLQKFDGVSRVETFSRTHDKVYKILNLTKTLSYTFMWILGAIGAMLMFKQARIWLYEHKERIEILTLFGASFWLKSGVLYRTAFIGSLVSTVVVVGFFYALPSIKIFADAANEIDVTLPKADILGQGAVLLGVALALSWFIISLVMRKIKKSDV